MEKYYLPFLIVKNEIFIGWDGALKNTPVKIHQKIMNRKDKIMVVNKPRVLSEALSSCLKAGPIIVT